MPWSVLQRYREERAEARALAHLPDAEFLAELYLRHLGRDLDESGRSYYLRRLQQGHSRLRVLKDIRHSQEAMRERSYRARLGSLGGFVVAPEPLVPDVLDRTPQRPKPRVALLGTCVAEGLLRVARDQDWPMVHHLLDSGNHPTVPELDTAGQDAILVHLTLRSLLGSVLADGDGDLFYLRDDVDLAQISRETQELLARFIDALLAQLPAGVPVFFLAFLEPPPQSDGILLGNRQRSLYRLVRDLNDALEAHLLDRARAYFLEINDIRQYYGDASVYDGYSEHFSHASLSDKRPQGRRIYQEILRRLEAALAILRVQDPVKLIVTDLDNTLWRGVLAEEDDMVPWQHLEGWPLGYAEALLTCKRRGILLAICSKNDEAATQERFRKLWGRRLRLEDFCVVRINWQPKSQNVAEILRLTNILPEHTLFIDDNPLEIDEVRRVYPRMRFLTGEPEHWRRVLLYAPETQVARIDEESAHRSELVQAGIAREGLAAQMGNRDEWLRSLDLHLTLESIPDDEHPRFARALELLNKTNQFNTTGKRWTAAELLSWLAQGGEILAGRVQDRFAQHGLVTVALWRGERIEQMVLSCRVFGLEIETALLAAVCERQRARGYLHSHGYLHDTGRNAVCLDFWARQGFRETEPGVWVGPGELSWPEHIALASAESFAPTMPSTQALP
ncbi:MAG: HAD-IIIC family phosphatase [Acidithiobacillus sp.]|uniref:HAD-IIIC family phosphatase n=1 Tax=Acidithiobacillus sp. TaxID=1872118 RepID=UPI003CFDF07C